MSGLCPTCKNVVAYPFCVNQFHNQPIPNAVVTELESVLERINVWWR
ncbi:MAG: hypothetical protein ACLQPV_07470 [Vulcanimicrobiaceae bacterium]